MANKSWGKWKQWQTIFSWAPKSLWMVAAAMKLKDVSSWKKSYDQPRQHAKKQRPHFADKDLVKITVFPVVTHGNKSWTIKKSERWRTDALELWCWRSCLRVSWTARRSNQSILKEINPEYSMLKWKLQYFGHLLQRADSLEKKPWFWEKLRAGKKNHRVWDV